MKSGFCYIVFFFLLSTPLLAQSCLSGTNLFTRQGQVDSIPILYPNCVNVLGTIRVMDVDSTPVTNLNGFEQITTIDGSLNLTGNLQLADMSGLNNLTTIGNNLSIVNHPVLSDLTGFSGLTTVNGDMNFSNNNGLTDMDGFQNLTTVGGDIRLYTNTGLTSLTGFDNIATIGEGLNISDCDGLTSMSGLNQLTSVGEVLLISGIFYLENLSGLENLTSVESFRLTFNSNLTDMTALSNLTTIDGDIYLYQNDKLASLSGLDNINHLQIDELTILDCDQLSMCDVESVCNFLEAGGASYISVNTAGCDTEEEVLEACNTVSVDPQLDEEQISVQPNPTMGQLRLDLPLENKTVCEVYNDLGKKMLITGAKEIDLSTFPNGMYTIKINHGDEQWIRRIVKL